MSGAIDVHRPKRVLFIAANPATSPTTGWPIGFWWAELSHPYWVFTEAGYEVQIASPKGGDLLADGFSDPTDASGYSADDLISLGFLTSPRHAAMVRGTPALAGLDPAGFDAIFVLGGQSPMVTMIGDTALHAFVAQAWEAGRIVAAVCHGTCILLETRLSSGDLLVAGRTWTGFANSEEDFADSFVGKPIQPFRIEDRAKAIAGTNFIVHARFKAFALRDGNLITGQQQFSGAAAARLVVEALGQ
jgi:putative intracellular protease/amidase